MISESVPGPLRRLTVAATDADLARAARAVRLGDFTLRRSGRRTAAAAAPVALAPATVDLVWAKQALNQREFGLAHERLEEALRLDPDSAEAHHLMGVLRESLGQHRAAYEAYRMALEADPRYWPALEDGALEPAYAGVRPKIYAPGQPAADFRIDDAARHGVRGVLNLFGIESPGLTASLALAGEAVSRIS